MPIEERTLEDLAAVAKTHGVAAGARLARFARSAEENGRLPKEARALLYKRHKLGREFDVYALPPLCDEVEAWFMIFRVEMGKKTVMRIVDLDTFVQLWP